MVNNPEWRDKLGLILELGVDAVAYVDFATLLNQLEEENNAELICKISEAINIFHVLISKAKQNG